MEYKEVFTSKRIKTNRTQSVASALMEKVIPYRAESTDVRKEKNYKRAKKRSATPYVLPPPAARSYHLSAWKNTDDTFIMRNVKGEETYTIFYIHGGSYWSPPRVYHYIMLHYLVQQTGAKAIIPVYPKAPTYTVAQAFPMVLKRYKQLLQKERSRKIILMGDSAGAGMALGLLQELRNKGIQMPQKVILMSPWMDVSMSNPAMPKIQPLDPLLSIGQLRFQGKVYAGDWSVKDPLLSPKYADLSGLPPVYVFSGTHDILHCDIEEYEKKAEKKGWPVTLYTYEKMNHVFCAFPIPEARKALKQMAEIIKSENVSE